MEPPYSKREIDEKWVDISNALSRIEIQTTTTNGKVAELQKWRYITMGGLSIISTLILPILFWALITLVNLDKGIRSVVVDVLSTYRFEVK